MVRYWDLEPRQDIGQPACSAAAAVLRWGVMTFDPLLPMLQLLHAFSFGATHLGSMQLLARLAPARQFATAQGDFATVLPLVMAGCMTLSRRAIRSAAEERAVGMDVPHGAFGRTRCSRRMTMATTVDDR